LIDESPGWIVGGSLTTPNFATADEVAVLRARVIELEERMIKMEEEFGKTVANLIKELSK